MPLSILVPMILIALPIVLVLVYLQSKDKPPLQLNETVARSQFILEHPGFEVDDIIVSDDVIGY